MTLTDHEKITEELENSPNDIRMYPEDIEYLTEEAELLEGEEETVEFNAELGHYTLIMSDGRRYRICAVCGHTKEMNLKAMKNNVPDLVKDVKQDYIDEGLSEEEAKEKAEKELCTWDNNTCEQRHPPYQAGYLQP